MPDSFQYRLAVLSDSEGIARVHTRSWQSAYRGLLPNEWLDALRWQDRKERWDVILSNAPARKIHVALDGTKEIIGFANAGPSRDEDSSEEIFELFAIYVAPESWGVGVGSTLLQRAIGDVPESARWLTLWVLKGNAQGRAFYESRGFSLDGATKLAEIDGHQLEEVRYRIALPLDPSK